ncbi:hypothetical protein AA3250_1318 [Gluconobacter albidus NBRC 3250]|nr:hypothetical protein AA3250_1318 [Gluconobacter albidus NBRC 3250]
MNDTVPEPLKTVNPAVLPLRPRLFSHALNAYRVIPICEINILDHFSRLSSNTL